MPVAPRTPRRQVILIITVSIILAIVFVASFRSQPLRGNIPLPDTPRAPAPSPAPDNLSKPSQPILTGHAIAPKLGNETLKASLGRSSWHLFHTIMARFPDTPTSDEKAALKSYIHLFQRLYPCGECATHFGEILERFPPQTSSRSAAAAWACHVHNEVNESLGKEVFNCAEIGEFYDCGCADEEKEGMNSAGGSGGDEEGKEMSPEEVERLTGANGRDLDPQKVPMLPHVKVEKRHRHGYPNP